MKYKKYKKTKEKSRGLERFSLKEPLELEVIV